VKTFPSYVFAAIGVALVVLGIAGLVYGDSDKARAISAIVAALGFVQVIFGGIKRRGEDAAVTTPTSP
jgi:hypothetical protein